MTTQELKNKIEKVLGNNIRCLLPSYWWKNLFHSVADRIDEVETTITENVNDMVVKSLKEFEAKHPDIERSTLYYTTDSSSPHALRNVTILYRWLANILEAISKPLYIAVPFSGESYYTILPATYRLNTKKGTAVEFLNIPFSDEKIYNVLFSFDNNGVAERELASSSSGGGSVMFVVDPLGNLTEEQKQENAAAYLKVIESEFAIDINIMVMFFIAKPNVVSFDNNENLVLTAAGIDGGASKFIFTPEGDVTIETVEPTSSGGVEIRELRISGSDEDNAYNLQTVELYKESKAIVVTPIMYNSSNPERTDRMQMPYYVDLYTNIEGVVAKFTFMLEDFRGGKYLINYTIKDDGSIEGSSSYTFDSAMSDESVNAVQNKVIKKYIDDAIANVGGGGGSDIVVDTEMSSTSTNPVQNKVVYSELQKKQGTISDLADIRSGAALGKTALQSEQYKGTITGVSANGTSVATSGVANIPAASTSAYGVTKLSSATNSTSTSLAATASAVKAAYDLANSYKGTVTGVKINGTTKNPSSGVVDLGTVITSHQDISHLATKEELNSLTNEIISNERVHAASLVDIDARIQDILTRLNNAGL